MMKHLDALLLVRLACLPERAGVMMVLPEGAISTCVHMLVDLEAIVTSCRSVSAYVLCHGSLKITLVFSADRMLVRNAQGQRALGSGNLTINNPP